VDTPKNRHAATIDKLGLVAFSALMTANITDLARSRCRFNAKKR
jgi:hypothetical protein